MYKVLGFYENINYNLGEIFFFQGMKYWRKTPQQHTTTTTTTTILKV
jgi:hypothetical protein